MDLNGNNGIEKSEVEFYHELFYKLNQVRRDFEDLENAMNTYGVKVIDK